MSARGITLIALGALGTAVLIGLDVQGPTATAVAVSAGVGTLAVFFVGTVVLLRSRNRRAEVARVDGLAVHVEPEARIRLLEGREAELLRQIETLEARRDEVVAETAAASVAGSRAASNRTPGRPDLLVVSGSD